MPAKLKSRLDEIAADLPDKVDGAVKAGAEVIKEGAKARVERRTGALHRAIHIEKGPGISYYVVAGDDDAFYGHMVEFGTSHSAPHPFLIPATEASRETVVGLVSASLRGL